MESRKKINLSSRKERSKNEHFGGGMKKSENEDLAVGCRGAKIKILAEGWR